MDKKPKIFIIEEEEVLAQSLTEFLRKENYDIEAAHNGEEALQMMPTVRPDLILLDIVLPQMNGIDFLKKIQEPNSEFKNIPVIIVTGLTGSKQGIEQMGIHVADYFMKASGSLKDLMEKIQTILKNGQ